jgi:ectoine hydroxylase-related dioxygenase (phytanoyl-CoA dioxygenase family)
VDGHVVGELSSFVTSFNDLGFGVIRGALDRENVAAIKQRSLDALERYATSDLQLGEPVERSCARIVEHGEEFLELAIAGQLVEVLRRIFGSLPTLVDSYVHEKPPGCPASTVIHSDISHLPGFQPGGPLLMAKVMYALTDIGDRAGGVAVVPGSHRLTADRRWDEEGLCGVVLRAGDLVLFNADLLHSTTQNSCDYSRITLWLTYAVPWVRAMNGHEFSAEFLDTLVARVAERPWLETIFGLGDPFSTGVR